MKFNKRRTKARSDKKARATRKGANASPRPKAKTTPASYATYLRIVLKYPGTEESISYGMPSVKVKGKTLSRLHTEAEGALALHCDFVDREMRLQANSEVFFITDYYKNYPMILIRLEKIRADALPELVERAEGEGAEESDRSV